MLANCRARLDASHPPPIQPQGFTLELLNPVIVILILKKSVITAADNRRISLMHSMTKIMGKMLAGLVSVMSWLGCSSRMSCLSRRGVVLDAAN